MPNPVPFRDERSCIASPRCFYDAAVPHDGSRENLLMRLHGMLESAGDLVFPGGKIRLLRLATEFVQDPSYWGGDGIAVGIPASYSAAQFREALVANFEIGAEFVVFDPVTRDLHGAQEPSPPGAAVPVNPGRDRTPSG